MSGPAPRLAARPWGPLPDGFATLFTLRNAQGTTVQVSDFGALLVSVRTPDRAGVPGEITLGYDRPESYVANPPCFGALVGRVANRIARGRFDLDGHAYTLATNNGPNHLHGGRRGFHQHRWHAEPFETPASSGIAFTRTSPGGEEGYPGTLTTKATYTLTDDGLELDLEAATDAPTLVNLTQHAYVNLDQSHGVRDVLGHRLTVYADAFLPTDPTQIPTGEVRAVDGTPFDLRTPTRLGDRLTPDVIAGAPQLAQADGFDHTFVLGDAMADDLRLAADVAAPSSGRTLTIWTTEPGVQVYTGNGLDGSLTGRGGTSYGQYAGLALETQHFPDAPNHSGFPSIVLRPGATYRSATHFRFGVAPS